MITIMRQSIKWCLVVLCFLGGISGQTWAQLAMIPEMMVIEALPEKEVYQEITVINTSLEKKEVWVEIEYRLPGPYQGKIKNWVEIKPSHFFLQKKRRRKVCLIFKPVASAMKGEAHLVFFVREELNSSVKVDLKTGIPVFVRLNKGVPPKGNIINLTKKRGPDGSWQFEAQVKNTGKMYLLPYGLSWMEDRAGKRVWTREVRLKQPLPPGKTRSLSWQLQPDLTDQSGKINLELFWGTMYGITRNPPRSRILSVVLP